MTHAPADPDGAHPPRLATRLLRRLCSLHRLEEAEGDLDEVFSNKLARRGRRWARAVYWKEVLLVVLWQARRREAPYQQARGPIMLKNYATIALRNLRKHKGYALLNVGGLGIGLAGCLLILLFVRDELRFDRFHEQADHIYRLTAEKASSASAMMPPLLGPLLVDDLPEVRHAVRFFNKDGVLITRTGATPTGRPLHFYEDRFLFADSNFFDVFSFSLKQGRPETALARPFTVVLTEAMAQKYFGEENPLGQTLLLDNTYAFEVTGVLHALPPTSSVQFNVLASFSTMRHLPDLASMLNGEWRVTAYPTYLLLRPEAASSAVEEKLPGLLARYTDASFILDKTYRLTPLTDVHIHAHAEGDLTPGSDVAYIYIFSSIAFLILLIACTNYMNLATARAARRAREVGIRKVVGAGRGQLARQFLGESLLLSLLAVPIALLLVELALPAFSALIQREIDTAYASEGFFGLALLGLVLGIGLLSGSYPALVLSRFRPVDVLKGQASRASAGALFRKGLVVFQFTVTAVLLAGTFIIQHQLDYVRTKRLGLDQERIVTLPLKHPSIREQADALAAALRQHAQVKQVALSSGIPTQPNARFAKRLEGQEALFTMSLYGIDTNLLETLGIELAEGRGFSPAFLDASGRTRVGGALVNEAAVRALGWDDPLGQKLPLQPNGHEYAVVGVVKDFHFASLHEAIQPIILAPLEDYWISYVSLKLEPGDLPAVLASLEKTWEQFSPDLPFEYFFLDDAFDQLYKAEDRLATIFNAFTLTAIVVACLGLFGLAAFTAEQRTKEIGIRKVLGATVSGIVLLLSRDLLKLVLVSVVIASPIAYLATQPWLDAFAYRVEISWPIFLMAGLTALLVALLTVSYQSIKAALADPVKSLRYE